MAPSTQLAPPEATSSGQHVEIFNPWFKATSTFAKSPRLPPELRWMVWEQALSHERCIWVKLLGVIGVDNVESYCLPCEYPWGNGTLYINPELDILEIYTYDMEHFADFAHQIWAQDRYHVGLVNFALDTAYDRLPANQQDIPLLRQVVSRLERVFFVTRHLSLPLIFYMSGYDRI
ncbi:hypothetical protein ACJZ2D_016355 [Fusarium nematophilum]